MKRFYGVAVGGPLDGQQLGHDTTRYRIILPSKMSYGLSDEHHVHSASYEHRWRSDGSHLWVYMGQDDFPACCGPKRPKTFADVLNYMRLYLTDKGIYGVYGDVNLQFAFASLTSAACFNDNLRSELTPFEAPYGGGRVSRLCGFGIEVGYNTTTQVPTTTYKTVVEFNRLDVI